jgi:hypothetical protein
MTTKRHLHLQSERQEQEEATFHALRGSLELRGPGPTEGTQGGEAPRGVLYLYPVYGVHRVAIHTYVHLLKYGWMGGWTDELSNKCFTYLTYFLGDVGDEPPTAAQDRDRQLEI